MNEWTEQLYSSCRYEPLAALEHDLEEQKNTRLSELEAKVAWTRSWACCSPGRWQEWWIQPTEIYKVAICNLDGDILISDGKLHVLSLVGKHIYTLSDTSNMQLCLYSIERQDCYAHFLEDVNDSKIWIRKLKFIVLVYYSLTSLCSVLRSIIPVV